MTTQSPKHGEYTVLWWIGWIVLTIVSFFICSSIWTPIIGKHMGTMDVPGAPVVWVIAVFGSWMALLVPLIIVMYNKVDRAYEDTRIQKEAALHLKRAAASGIKSVFIPEEERLLSSELIKKIKKIPRTIKRGHLVTVVTKEGKRFHNVFIVDREVVVGVYGYDLPPFCVANIIDILETDLDKLPPFETEGWLRLDGAGL